MTSTYTRLTVMFPNPEDVKTIKKLAIDYNIDTSTLVRAAALHLISQSHEEIKRVLEMHYYQESKK